MAKDKGGYKRGDTLPRASKPLSQDYSRYAGPPSRGEVPAVWNETGDLEYRRGYFNQSPQGPVRTVAGPGAMIQSAGDGGYGAPSRVPAGQAGQAPMQAPPINPAVGGPMGARGAAPTIPGYDQQLVSPENPGGYIDPETGYEMTPYGTMAWENTGNANDRRMRAVPQNTPQMSQEQIADLLRSKIQNRLTGR
jgi:hypothetical protein